MVAGARPVVPGAVALARMEIPSSSICSQLFSLNCTLTFNSCEHLNGFYLILQIEKYVDIILVINF